MYDAGSAAMTMSFRRVKAGEVMLLLAIDDQEVGAALFRDED